MSNSFYINWFSYCSFLPNRFWHALSKCFKCMSLLWSRAIFNLSKLIFDFVKHSLFDSCCICYELFHVNTFLSWCVQFLLNDWISQTVSQSLMKQMLSILQLWLLAYLDQIMRLSYPRKINHKRFWWIWQNRSSLNEL